jgi:hypothetical protein
LNGAGWALDFASSTDQAIIYLDWDRFAVLHFVDAYWAGVYAGFASSARIVVTVAEKGKEATEKLSINCYDIALIDLGLPHGRC